MRQYGGLLLAEGVPRQHYCAAQSVSQRTTVAGEAYWLWTALIIVVLYVIWIVIGVVIFVNTGAVWPLLSSAVLMQPLRKIIDYYFGAVGDNQQSAYGIVSRA